MSAKYPIISVTGSSGAGTTTASNIFNRIFADEGINAGMIQGDSFHKYTRTEMSRRAAKGHYGEWNHFSLDANHVDKLEALFQDYAATGTGQYRQYVHDDDFDLTKQGWKPGTFTSWMDLSPDTDVLFYEGLHGGILAEQVNIASHVDLLIGVVPIVNLEWIQKIHRDTQHRGYSKEAVVNTIVNRMDDYVRCIVPQFSNTHINFQRVPTVDTSNPFVMSDVPTDDESMVVIHFRQYSDVDFPYLLQMINGSFISRQDTLVIPGNKMPLAMDLIIRPRVKELMAHRVYG